ncbi:MAG TPA: hypothetical protein ENH90_00200 [bacterium]|nr:hypothetical protein [bacterium]
MVEIIPKPVKETDRWQKILIYLSMFLAIVLVGSYFLLDNLEKTSKVYIDELEKRLEQGRTAERITLEEENLNYNKKIEAIIPFLETHVLSSKFFEFLEKKVHPRVFFAKINLSVLEEKVILFGKTDSFLTLQQQLSILNREPMIENLALTNIALNAEGGIDFNLDIFFNKEIFKY